MPVQQNPSMVSQRRALWRLVAVLFALLWSGIWTPPLAHGQPPAPQDAPLSWLPLGGPSGSISYLSADPGAATVYAAVEIISNRREDQTLWSTEGTPVRSAALYRSQDGGATWQPATNNLIPGPITALLADQESGTVWVGLQSTQSAGVGPAETGTDQQSSLWASRDQGAHWQPVPLGEEGLRIRRISRGAKGDQLLLGATGASAAPGQKPASYVLRSNDGGATWESTRLPTDDQRPDSVLTDLIPHPVAANRLFVTTGAGEIYASSDLGRTWVVALGASPAPASPPTPPPGGNLRQPSATPTPAGTSAEVVARTVYLAIAPDRPDLLLAARAESPSGSAGMASRLALQRSTNAGATWSAVPVSGLPAEALPNTLAALPASGYLLSTNFGSYRSTDGGTTWQLLEGPLSSGDVSTFVTLPGSPASVLAATAYGLYASKDAGAIWQAHGKGLPFNSGIAGLLTDSRQPNRVFAVTYADYPLAGPAPAADHQPTSDFRPPLLLRSSDGGTTWTPASSDLPGVTPMAWALDPNDPNTLFISTREHLFRTTDAGLNWHTATLPAGGHYALAIAPSDSNLLYLGGNPLLRSIDRGATWQELAPIVAGAAGGEATALPEVTGLVIDPSDAAHLWASVSSKGAYESRDGGASWQTAGQALDGKPVRWLAGATGPYLLYAGVTGEGIYRWDPQGRTWTPASNGLPAQSTILAFVSDPRQPGTLWAGRDGGGVYRSTDSGTTWRNASSTAASGGTAPRKTDAGIGDNLVQALANDFTTGGSLFLGTATAGLWALRSDAQPAPAPRAVDARIEVVWPHSSAPVPEARLANIGLRLFTPGSLLQPPCGWSPEVTVWQAEDNSPAKPLDAAGQRTVDGNPFPFWELNDVDVSYAADPQHKLYFMIQVPGVESATSIWTHGSDPRTHYPFPEVPSGVVADKIEAVDARIQVVWPHDAAGNQRGTSEADYVNVSVALYKHGTRLSVPVGWTPAGMQLQGAWNQEIGQALAMEGVVQVRKAGAITYPTWEFNNIPVGWAKDPANKVHLWVRVDGVDTYPTIWTHGADARTLFPAKDEPVQGCIP
jgi:photosystem II stability/assembly factor-like uncharacterized protein